jgi:hypothetical protein
MTKKATKRRATMRKVTMKRLTMKRVTMKRAMRRRMVNGRTGTIGTKRTMEEGDYVREYANAIFDLIRCGMST